VLIGHEFHGLFNIFHRQPFFHPDSPDTGFGHAFGFQGLLPQFNEDLPACGSKLLMASLNLRYRPVTTPMVSSPTSANKFLINCIISSRAIIQDRKTYT
jgi:hypothetical protein